MDPNEALAEIRHKERFLKRSFFCILIIESEDKNI